MGSPVSQAERGSDVPESTFGSRELVEKQKPDALAREKTPPRYASGCDSDINNASAELLANPGLLTSP